MTLQDANLIAVGIVAVFADSTETIVALHAMLRTRNAFAVSQLQARSAVSAFSDVVRIAVRAAENAGSAVAGIGYSETLNAVQAGDGIAAVEAVAWALLALSAPVKLSWRTNTASCSSAVAGDALGVARVTGTGGVVQECSNNA